MKRMHKTNKAMMVLMFMISLVMVFTGFGCRAQAPQKTSDTHLQQTEGIFDYHHIKLENGLDVITLEDFSCPIVSVQVWYHVGSKNEKPDRGGLCSYVRTYDVPWYGQAGTD